MYFTRSMAVLASAGLAVLFILFIYVPSWVTSIPKGSKKETVSRSASVIVASLIGFYALSLYDPSVKATTLFKMNGFSFAEILSSVFYVLLIFAADVVWMVVSNAGNYREFLRDALRFDHSKIKSVIIAPLVEEFVFRGIVTNIILSSDFDKSAVIFLSPAFFSLAHLHQAISKPIAAFFRPGAPKKVSYYLVMLGRGLVQGLFQAAYTYLFGLFSTIMFLNSSTIWGVVVGHMLCNAFGFPKIQEYVSNGLILRIALLSIQGIGFAMFMYYIPKTF